LLLQLTKTTTAIHCQLCGHGNGGLCQQQLSLTEAAMGWSISGNGFFA
jgi:hypothetical protein